MVGSPTKCRPFGTNSGRLGRPAGAASRTSVATTGPHRIRLAPAVHAPGRNPRHRPGCEPSDHDPFHSKGLIGASPAPELDRVAGSEAPRDGGEGLRRLEDPAGDPGPSESEKEVDVAPAEGLRIGGDDSPELGRGERTGGTPAAMAEMVAGPLVRSEQQPAVHRLGPDPSPGTQRSLRSPRPESEQDGTRCVGGDHRPAGRRVVAEEQVRLALRRRADRRGVDGPRSGRSRGPVGDQLPCPASSRPRRRRGGPHEAAVGAGGSPPRVSLP
jgi:hypothetical protein